MEKYEATKTLTEKLVELNGRLIISDDIYKRKLLKEAKHAYVIGHSLDMFSDRDFLSLYYVTKTGDDETVKSKDIGEVVGKIAPPAANYVFLSEKRILNEYKALMTLTPYSIIGDKEEESIRKSFYKTYDSDVREAIASLGIKDFFDLYHAYLHNNEKFNQMFCNDFEKFRNEFLEFSQSRTYDSANETRLEQFDAKFKIEKLNRRLGELGVKFIFPTLKQASWIKKREIESLADMLKNHISPIDKDPLNKEFLRFVFEIPYEDQNLEMNKHMFKNFGNFLDQELIMLKEYSNGKHFKEYFGLLDAGKQKDVSRLVKNAEVQSQDINHFLWMMGSKDIRLDYLKLYKEDAEEFIEYFNERRSEEKKVILKDVMEYDFINDKVTEWLNEHEADLIREVGFDG
ncbi:hypothetical protein FJZ53_02585 [Candidatus Woesearchaeota archaeon]|nr:hypothetical protein [Candidatus Woesearchaeota archaeon]